MTIPTQEDFKWFIEMWDNQVPMSRWSVDSKRKWFQIRWCLIENNDGHGHFGGMKDVFSVAEEIADMTDEEYILWKLGQ